MNRYIISYKEGYFRPGLADGVTIEAEHYIISERWIKFFVLAMPVFILDENAVLSVKIEKIEDAS